jgi:dihydroorotase
LVLGTSIRRAIYVQSADRFTAATVTATYGRNRNAIFTGGIRPLLLPAGAQARVHRLAVDAATSETGKFFLGTDSAPPHPAHLKNTPRIRRLLRPTPP